MRIILSQRFPLGRFHANPWKAFTFDDPYGEWPPSPWRLLRGIIARSHQLEREQPEIGTFQRETLSHAFCASTLSWQLPEFSWRGPGLRQYQPTEFKKVPAAAKEPGQMTYNTTKVQDNFWLTANPAPQLFWILEADENLWTPEILDHLDACIARMTYFGRAESITEISRLTTDACDINANCFLRVQRTAKTVPVLCPRADASLEQIQFTTDDKAVADASSPPGGVWLFAERQALSKRIPQLTRKSARELPPVQMMQFALGGRVFPPEQSWIRVTERFRGSVLKELAKNITGEPQAQFHKLTPKEQSLFSLMTGKATDNLPLSNHAHTSFFLIPDADGKPTRLVCYRQIPFTSQEQEAMLAASERSIAWEYGSDDWQLRLVPLHVETLLPKAITGTAKTWESITHYVPSRHVLRRNGKPKAGSDIPSQIGRDLDHLKLSPAIVTIVGDVETNPVRWVKVHCPQRIREGQTNDIKRGYRLRLEFERPVQGPIALGHSSHFGLGLFVPVA